MKSIVLVAVQLGCLLILALTGPLVARHPLLLLLEMLGGALGIWAIVALRLGNFHIVPDVKRDGMMVRRGPYRFIRHPMYTAVLMVSLALVADHFTVWRCLILIVLVVDLLVKLHYEEGLLTAAYVDYPAYMQETRRLIPYVY